MEFFGFPYIVGWELTMACNMRCKHCASSSGLPRRNELTLNEALKICDMFPDLLVKEVDFTGGEPFLSPNWHLIARYINKMSITTRILSNGLLLNHENIAKMKEAGISSAGVSIDGLEPTHDYIRGHGAFRSAFEGIERVAKEGIVTTVITSANALNIKQLPDIQNYLNNAGVKFWQIQPTIPTGRCKNFTDLHLSSEDYLHLGIFFREARLSASKAQVEIIPADSLGYFTDMDIPDPTWEGCPAGHVTCGITSDGKVKGCLSLPDEVIEGDLRQRDMWDIWFDKNSFSYSRSMNETEAGSNCKDCEKIEQCKGGCSAMSFGSTGKFHNDPYCFFGIIQRSRVVNAYKDREFNM